MNKYRKALSKCNSNKKRKSITRAKTFYSLPPYLRIFKLRHSGYIPKPMNVCS